MQWIDSKPVTIISTPHSANAVSTCKRRMKVDGRFRKVEVTQPRAIHDYNQCMNGVDRSDQLIAAHNVNKKCYRWWKTLFFHIIDIAVVHGFLLFQSYKAEHEDNEDLRRSRSYSVVDFTEALVTQICKWSEYDDPPAYVSAPPVESQFETAHMPVVSDCSSSGGTCAVYSWEDRGLDKVRFKCEKCNKFFHLQAGLNCFQTWHAPGYSRR